MLFNSWQFALFFPLVTLGYFLLPYRARWAWLLAASCLFYMAFVPVYILILAGTIAVDYVAGLAIAGATGRRRRYFLLASLAANLGVLAFFKYFNFFNANLAALAELIHWNYPIQALSILLPIGLSFHVFQSLSYTIEVYRGNQPPERHPGIFALYVMFYPQLVAGPIERPQNLLHQFHEPHPFVREDVVEGLRRMLWGLFKKVVVADRLAIPVNLVFADPQAHTGPALVLAAVLFSFQIYCDFSGYSDIAVGSARVMGFRLMENFRQPYFARSVSEFWTRWHISLSTWFKDYLYVPLGGNRVAPLLWARNILVVFMVSGLWHGANWTFVVWGALHGLALLLERACEPWRSRLPAVIRVAATFALVTVAWIFFRATSLADGWYIVSHLASSGAPLATVMTPGSLALAMGVILVTLAVEAGRRTWLLECPRWVRWSCYYGLVLAIALMGNYGGQTFIYFQF